MLEDIIDVAGVDISLTRQKVSEVGFNTSEMKIEDLRGKRGNVTN